MRPKNQGNINNIVTDWHLGKVAKGKGRGGRLGFPTINLKLNYIDFSYGVYLCQALVDNAYYQGLLFYGPRLTFKETQATVELFLINYNKTTKVNSRIKFKLGKLLRKVIKFSSKEALARQIKRDLKAVN